MSSKNLVSLHENPIRDICHCAKNPDRSYLELGRHGRTLIHIDTHQSDFSRVRNCPADDGVKQVARTAPTRKSQPEQNPCQGLGISLSVDGVYIHDQCQVWLILGVEINENWFLGTEQSFERFVGGIVRLARQEHGGALKEAGYS